MRISTLFLLACVFASYYCSKQDEKDENPLAELASQIGTQQPPIPDNTFSDETTVQKTGMGMNLLTRFLADVNFDY